MDITTHSFSLDEALGNPGARISPAAASFLIDAGIEVSYAKAARLLEHAGSSSVSARTVMNLFRKSGEACEEDDVACAHDLYVNAELPQADSAAKEICLEVDGTMIPLQDGTHVEIKAMLAYEGKSAGKRQEKDTPSTNRSSTEQEISPSTTIRRKWL